MPIDEEVRTTPRRAHWPVAVICFALIIFIVAFQWLWTTKIAIPESAFHLQLVGANAGSKRSSVNRPLVPFNSAPKVR